jgi:serine/threonine protein kinase
MLKDFVKYTCLALSALSEEKIVHADIKPDNILVKFDD